MRATRKEMAEGRPDKGGRPLTTKGIRGREVNTEDKSILLEVKTKKLTNIYIYISRILYYLPIDGDCGDLAKKCD